VDDTPRLTTFADLIGQDHAIGVLTGAIDRKRVHHAWIFAGPEGVGKGAAAKAFGALLLDPDAKPDLMGNRDADPESRTARLIAAGSHPDFHLIRKELAAVSDDPQLRAKKQRNIPIALLRERMLGGLMPSGKFVESVAWKAPQMAPAKVFIVDEAELLAREGQNAMLKTLEEPPKDSYIVLVTTAEERLLPTVRSRCQRVRFRSLTPDQMDRWRAGRDLDVSDRDWAWIRRFSDGSPGRALQAVETGLIAWAPVLDAALADVERRRYPFAAGADLAKLLDDWAKGWVERGEKRGDRPSKEAANHEAMRRLVALLAAWARDRMRDDAAADPPAAERWAQAVTAITHAERAIASNVQPVFVLDDLFAQLTAA